MIGDVEQRQNTRERFIQRSTILVKQLLAHVTMRRNHISNGEEQDYHERINSL